MIAIYAKLFFGRYLDLSKVLKNKLPDYIELQFNAILVS